jgi:hypothetical protein
MPLRDGVAVERCVYSSAAPKIESAESTSRPRQLSVAAITTIARAETWGNLMGSPLDWLNARSSMDDPAHTGGGYAMHLKYAQNSECGSWMNGQQRVVVPGILERGS